MKTNLITEEFLNEVERIQEVMGLINEKWQANEGKIPHFVMYFKGKPDEILDNDGERHDMDDLNPQELADVGFYVEFDIESYDELLNAIPPDMSLNSVFGNSSDRDENGNEIDHPSNRKFFELYNEKYGPMKLYVKKYLVDTEI